MKSVENPKDIIADSKIPFHLVSPLVKMYAAIAHFLGMIKYGAWNWRAAGVRSSVYYSALQRHIGAWWEGQKYDPADGTPHLANALACLNILIEAEEMGKLIDDRPPSGEAALMRIRKEFEDMIPRIREQYKDKNPRHWTIKDTDEASANFDIPVKVEPQNKDERLPMPGTAPMVECNDCEGEGVVAVGLHDEDCLKCNGRGWVTSGP